MHQLLFKSIRTKVIFSLSLIILSAHSFATESYYSSTLRNQSKQSDPDGYYLIRDKVWSEHGGCVVDSGSKRLNPGESTLFKINKQCKSGGVQYQIFSLINHELVGYLFHNFHNGSFSMEIKQLASKKMEVNDELKHIPYTCKTYSVKT